jgi:WD40 repeat protein
MDAIGSTLTWREDDALFQLDGPRGISSLIFLADGKHVVCACKAEKTIQMWNIEDHGKREPLLMNLDVAVNVIASSKDGTLIVTGDVDGMVVVWDISLRKRCEAAEGHGRMITALDVSPPYVASGSNDGTVVLWTIREPESGPAVPGPLMRHARGSISVSSVEFSPAGSHIASACAHWGCSVRIWHTRTGDQIESIRIDGSPTHSLAWSSDGRRLFAGGSSGSIHCFDTVTRKPFSKVVEPRPGDDSISSLRVSDSGQFLISFSAPGRTVDIWDIRDALAYKPLHSYGRCVSASISPDDLYLVSSGNDTKISIRNLSGVVESSYFFHVGRYNLHEFISSFLSLARRSFTESLRARMFDPSTPVY